MGLEHHTPENIREEIEYAVAHDTDFHQFMLYTPVPGTPLYAEMDEQGRMLPDVDLADIHGQYKFNFQHAAISRDESKKFLDWAFRRDFERNGPSLYRICRTTLEGWKRYKNHPDLRVRERFEWEARQLRNAASACLWAMERRLEEDQRGRERADPRAAPGHREGVRPADAAWPPGWSVPCCCGPAAARKSAWPPAGSTSRPPSSSAATGSKRSITTLRIHGLRELFASALHYAQPPVHVNGGY